MATDLDHLSKLTEWIEGLWIGDDSRQKATALVRAAIAELESLRKPHPDTVLLNWIIGLGRLPRLHHVRGDCWAVGEAGWVRRTPREAIEAWLQEESWEPGDPDPWRWHAPEFEAAMKEFRGSLTEEGAAHDQ